MKTLTILGLTSALFIPATATHALGPGGISVDVGAGAGRNSGAAVSADVTIGRKSVDADVLLGGSKTRPAASATVNANAGGSQSGSGGLSVGAGANVGSTGTSANVSASLGGSTGHGSGGNGDNAGGGNTGGSNTGGGASGGNTGGSNTAGGAAGGNTMTGGNTTNTGGSGGSTNSNTVSGNLGFAASGSNDNGLSRRSFAPVQAPAPLLSLAGLTVWTHDNVFVGVITNPGDRAGSAISVAVQLNPKLGLRNGLVQFQFTDSALRGDRIILNMTGAQLAQRLS